MNKNPFWKFFKFFLTIFIAILIPTYWYFYGMQNFLWLSDIGLFLTLLGLWTHSRLLMSMAAVGVLLVELAWNVDFFSKLIFRGYVINLSEYMFNNSYPLMLRGLSSFHIFMPIIWIVYVLQYGYDKRALYYWIVLYWLILPLTYFFTDPKKNINWVFSSEWPAVSFIPPILWLLLLCIAFPLLIFLPSHYLLKKIANRV